jgi:hypothetical protein
MIEHTDRAPGLFWCCPGREKHHLILHSAVPLHRWPFWYCVFCHRCWNLGCAELDNRSTLTRIPLAGEDPPSPAIDSSPPAPLQDPAGRGE